MKNKMKGLFSVVILVSAFSNSASADAPVYEFNWEKNNNVTVSKIIGFWNQGRTYVKFSNGQYCHIVDTDTTLLTLAITAKAQQAQLDSVCKEDPDATINGSDSRRLHKLTF